MKLSTILRNSKKEIACSAIILASFGGLLAVAATEYPEIPLTSQDESSTPKPIRIDPPIIRSSHGTGATKMVKVSAPIETPIETAPAIPTAPPVVIPATESPVEIVTPAPVPIEPPVEIVEPAPVETAPEFDTLPPCPFDEATDLNCYWDAETQGNGEGDSFVVIDTRVYYLP